MPPKGFRSLSEDTISVSTRVPLSLVPAIEAHTIMLKRQTPYLKVSQADALRDLIIRGLQITHPDLNLFGGGEDQPKLTAPMNQPGIANPLNRPEIAVNMAHPMEPLNAPTIPQTHASMAPVGMKQCSKGHTPYPIGKSECPTCIRDRKRNQRKRQAQTLEQIVD